MLPRSTATGKLTHDPIRYRTVICGVVQAASSRAAAMARFRRAPGFCKCVQMLDYIGAGWQTIRQGE